MNDLQSEVSQQYRDLFGTAPQWIVRAPGRVNLIGEHTDYNDGFVLPMAIDRATWIAIGPAESRTVRVHLMDFGRTEEFSLDDITPAKASPVEYIKGVAAMLQADNYPLNGWQGVLKGDIPIGAGLSSSAAMEMAVARAFGAVSGFDWDAPKMALLGQRVENIWLKLKTGIMDQMISAAGQAGHALLIDCRTLELTPAPMPDGVVAVVMDTGTRRGLVHSAYNERREQCESAAQHFGVKALRDVSVDQFASRADELDELTRKRARHVVTENARTLAAYEAMTAGDARILGALMDASHESLRDDFEVSTDALNTMVTIAHRHPGCLGARMTGAGFGGCAVALVKAEAADDFTGWVAPQYETATGNKPSLYICTASQGASIEAVS
jgi:galactokinase